MAEGLTFSLAPRLALGKAKWDVHDEDIIMRRGEDSFVQLRKGGLNYGFPRLVYAAIGSVFDKRDWSLSKSNGYKKLQELRNEAQRDELNNGELAKLPVWQRATAQPKKNTSQSRDQIKAAREGRSVMTIHVPGGNGKPDMAVEMLRPALKGDELVCKLCPTTLRFVIDFIAEMGFDDDLKRASTEPGLPKGAKRKGNTSIIKLPDGFSSNEGKRSRKSLIVPSKEAAEQALEDPEGYMGVSHNEDVCDDEEAHEGAVSEDGATHEQDDASDEAAHT